MLQERTENLVNTSGKVPETRAPLTERFVHRQLNALPLIMRLHCTSRRRWMSTWGVPTLEFTKGCSTSKAKCLRNLNYEVTAVVSKGQLTETSNLRHIHKDELHMSRSSPLWTCLHSFKENGPSIRPCHAFHGLKSFLNMYGCVLSKALKNSLRMEQDKEEERGDMRLVWDGEGDGGGAPRGPDWMPPRCLSCWTERKMVKHKQHLLSTCTNENNIHSFLFCTAVVVAGDRQHTHAHPQEPTKKRKQVYVAIVGRILQCPPHLPAQVFLGNNGMER